MKRTNTMHGGVIPAPSTTEVWLLKLRAASKTLILGGGVVALYLGTVALLLWPVFGAASGTTV